MSEVARPITAVAVDSTTEDRRPLRVCHLAYTFYENDNRVRRYADALAARGHKVDVVALRRNGQAKAGHMGSVRVFRVQRRVVTEKSQVAYLLKILAFLARSMVFVGLRHLGRPYDVVHVHNVPDFLVIAAIVPKLFGARVILDIHDILPELYAGKFGAASSSRVFRALLWIERMSSRLADHVIVANDLWRDKLTSRAVDPAKCTTLLNYPDLQIFKPIRPSEKRRDGRFVMLYPGTLNYHQGVDIAIRAFASVFEQMPNAEFHIYGEGPARVELAALASTFERGCRIHIHDPLPLEQIAGVIASADVGIVPKRADGFGNEAFSTKILEFMACGVPVIVSRTKVDQHYFDDSLVRFFTPGSDSELADAMLSLYLAGTADHDWIDRIRSFALSNSWQERSADYQSLVEGGVTPSSHRPETFL